MPLLKLTEDVHQKLKRLAAESDMSMQALLRQLLQRQEDERFWSRMEAAFSDPEVQDQTQREMAAWDTTLLDGLEEEKPPARGRGRRKSPR